jgi:hypothetical protein
MHASTLMHTLHTSPHLLLNRVMAKKTRRPPAPPESGRDQSFESAAVQTLGPVVFKHNRAAQTLGSSLDFADSRQARTTGTKGREGEHVCMCIDQAVYQCLCVEVGCGAKRTSCTRQTISKDLHSPAAYVIGTLRFRVSITPEWEVHANIPAVAICLPVQTSSTSRTCHTGS